MTRSDAETEYQFIKRVEGAKLRAFIGKVLTVSIAIVVVIKVLYGV